MSLMDDNGVTREDLKLPEGDLGKEMETRHASDETLLVTVLKAMDEEAVIGLKTAQANK